MNSAIKTLLDSGTGSQSASQPGRTISGLTVQEWFLVIVAVSTMTLPAVMPVMVGTLAGTMGFGPEKAGFIASVNTACILLGAPVAALLSRKFTPRAILVAGLCGMIAGNLLALMSGEYSWIFLTRSISGFFEGLAAGICYALMGRGSNPSRIIAFYAAGQGLIGAVGMAVIPTLVSSWGWELFFVAISVIAIPAVFLVPAAVDRPGLLKIESENNATGKKVAFTLPLVLSAISLFLFFTAMGATWGYTERIGALHGFSVSSISLSLSTASAASLVGSLLVGIFAYRIRTTTASFIGAACSTLAFTLLLSSEFPHYFISVILLNALWGFQFPFLFRNLATADTSGIATGLTPSLNGSALVVSFALGGFLFERFGTISLFIYGTFAATTAMTLCFLVARYQEKK